MSEEKPLNVPEYLLIRSAEARAKHLGISVEQALAEIKGESQPVEEPVVEEPVEEPVVEEVVEEVVEKPAAVKIYRDAAGKTWEVDEDGNRTRVGL